MHSRDTPLVAIQLLAFRDTATQAPPRLQRLQSPLVGPKSARHPPRWFLSGFRFAAKRWLVVDAVPLRA